ncbi:MAG: hypothetical protein AB7F91_05145 [Parvularculaceae bacterium]
MGSNRIYRAFAAMSVLIAASACATASAPSASGKAGAHNAAGEPAFILADLADKSADEIDGVLGAPDLVRIEGAGEFRRYALADCALIIILYPDDAGVKRAKRLEAGALTSGAEKPDLDRCLARGKAEG